MSITFSFILAILAMASFREVARLDGFYVGIRAGRQIFLQASANATAKKRASISRYFLDVAKVTRKAIVRESRCRAAAWVVGQTGVVAYQACRALDLYGVAYVVLGWMTGVALVFFAFELGAALLPKHRLPSAERYEILIAETLDEELM